MFISFCIAVTPINEEVLEHSCCLDMDWKCYSGSRFSPQKPFCKPPRKTVTHIGLGPSYNWDAYGHTPTETVIWMDLRKETQTKRSDLVMNYQVKGSLCAMRFISCGCCFWSHSTQVLMAWTPLDTDV